MFVSSLAVAIFAISTSAPNSGIEKLIEPPFVRKWTALTGDWTKIVGVANGVIYYRSQKGIGASSLATGKQLWLNTKLHDSQDGLLLGPTIIAVMDSEGSNDGWLVRVNISDGQSRKLMSLPTSEAKLVSGFGRIFILDRTSTVRAVQPSTGRILWSRSLVKEEHRYNVTGQILVTRAGLFIGVDERDLEKTGKPKILNRPPSEFGLDPATDNIRWSRPAAYAGLYRPTTVGGDVITQIDGVRRTSIRTGKVVWHGGKEERDPAVVGDVVVANDRKALIGHNGATGKVLWRIPLRDKSVSYGSSDEAPPITNEQSVWLDRWPFLCVTKGGTEKWHAARPFTGTPVYADGQTLIVSDKERILCYRNGTLPPQPKSDSERQALAAKIVAEYEALDDAEREQLRALTPYSFTPLLNRYIHWAKSLDSKPDYSVAQFTYGLLIHSSPTLMATFQKGNTPEIVQALAQLGDKSRWRGALEEILQKKGDQGSYIPSLIAQLRKNPENRESQALSAVSHSTDPRAVEFMLQALRDPKSPFEWRSEAFTHLAGTGGEAGINAVREARSKAGSRKPWWDRINLAMPGRYEVIATKADSMGKTWTLFKSGALGNFSDLFIAEKVGSSWGKPIFTGVWTESTFGKPPPAQFHGIPIAKLITTEWIKVLPNDESIRKDADGDGLTDVVEARLGTDPNKADTDGDGEPDSTDPCPNAAPQPLNDDQKIIAACIDARFFGQGASTPATLSVEGVTPFELYGYRSTLMWTNAGKASPLGAVYGGGMNSISFHSAEDRRGSTPITYSPDRKTAQTVIRRYSGGLNGEGYQVTLKKIGDEWFAVDMRMLYIS